MQNNMDPRIQLFYKQSSAGAFAGIPQGDYTGSFPTFSVPSSVVGADISTDSSAAAPVNFLTGYESLFLQAEVVARNWVNPGPSDATLFYDAIQANFNSYNTEFVVTTGVTGALNYTTYIGSARPAVNYPIGGSTEQKIRSIMLQKWYAMCGNQGFEAWTELRRTGMDSILTPSFNSSIGSQLPKRLLYPSVESNYNASFPGLLAINQKVWWDLY
jgi:hypothetical protein